MAQPATEQSDVHQESHGHSLASWMLVAILLLGIFVVCLAIVLELLWLAIIGLVVCVIGLVLGRLLQMAGFGVHKPAASGKV
jgi:CHASE2 domain-containing sensor protein